MPDKLTLKEVKTFIDGNSRGQCKLISTKYINSTTPLLLRCKCGNTFYRTFNKLRLKRFNCGECKKEKARKKYALSYEQVKSYIESKNCTLISENYYNSGQKILIQCSCGNLFWRTFNKFHSGQITCNECSLKRLAKSKTKYSKEYVKEKIKEKGYTLVGEYKNAFTPVLCKCSKGHIFDLKFSHFLNGHSGCKKCANLAHSGEKHHNYKGGENEAKDFLRKSLKVWKLEVFKKSDFKCYITGTKNDLVIHHIKSFSNIVKEVLQELNLGNELKLKIKDYTDAEIKEILHLFLQKHTLDIGVVIERSLHNDFHKIYGKGNNTLEQFNEFLSLKYPNVKSL